MSDPVVLSPGANSAVESAAIRLTVSARFGVIESDLQALLLTASGKVRDDRDFVFFNAPQHWSGAVRLSSGAMIDLLTLDLNTVESIVERIVVCQSTDEAFTGETQFMVTIEQPDGRMLHIPTIWPGTMPVIMLAEFYRHRGGWKVRALGQGWSGGLAALVTEFGVDVDHDERSAGGIAFGGGDGAASGIGGTTTAGVPASWYEDPGDPRSLRWWDGSAWTEHVRARNADVGGGARCARCGLPLKTRRITGKPAPCRGCAAQVKDFMRAWQSGMAEVLASDGPRGDRWSHMWGRLRNERIDEAVGWAALESIGLAYLERLVAFAFADDAIEDSEMAEFENTVSALRLPQSRRLDGMFSRMRYGQELTRLRSGVLPTLNSFDIHLDSGELLYLDVPAEQIRHLASGVKRNPGRLLVSNKKVRFVGTSGSEMSWAKIVGVHADRSTVDISATTARGGGVYAVKDAAYTAAVVEGALRLATRQVLVPGRRDTRSIPQHVRNAVWQRCGGRCVECGDTEYLEFDHIIPHSKGGATSESNLQVLCRGCNMAKSDRI